MAPAELSGRAPAGQSRTLRGRWRRLREQAWRLVREGAAALGRTGRRACAAARRRAVPPLAGLLLGLSAAPAQADLWVYVDPEGTMHLSEDPRDKRYQRYVPPQPGDDLATPDDLPADRTPQIPTPEQLTFFEISHDYKAVKHHLREAARRYQVDYALLQALVATESRFDAQAVSHRGAVGLMQLMPATAAHYGVKGGANATQATRLADPRTNILTGTRHLRYLIDRFPGRLDLAVAAYNAGEGAVRRAGNEVPPYRETQSYVKNVLALYAALKPPPAPSARVGEGRVRARLQAEPAVRTASAAVGGALALVERAPKPLAPTNRSESLELTSP